MREVGGPYLGLAGSETLCTLTEGAMYAFVKRNSSSMSNSMSARAVYLSSGVYCLDGLLKGESGTMPVSARR